MLIHTIKDWNFTQVDDYALIHNGCIVDVGCSGWDWCEFFIGKKRVIGIDPYESPHEGTEFFNGLLGPVNGYVKIKRDGANSTTIGEMELDNTNDYRTFEMLNWKTFCKKFNIESVSVLKINIEGGEYPLLLSMDKHDFDKIEQISVSFHDFHNPELSTSTETIIRFLENHGYTHQHIDSKYGWHLFVKNSSVNNVTIVTGLWDLGRQNLSGWAQRDFSKYKENFFKLLHADVPMCIWIPKELEEEVWKIRKPKNTKIFYKEVEDFKTWFPFFKEHDAIRTNPDWYNSAAWLPQSPQAALELYNPMMMTKMFMVNDSVIHNPFNTQYFYWVDGGLTSTVSDGYFTDGKIFNNITRAYSDSIVHITYPYSAADEIHGFKKSEMYKSCRLSENEQNIQISRGGFWGGPKELISEYNGLYYDVLSSTIKSGNIGADECLFTILAYRYPEIVERFQVEGNGLIWPFFEAMKDIHTFLKNRPKKQVTHKTAKSNLYVLAFNSPKQFETLCESIKENSPEFLERPRKILINNSTDESLFPEYDRLCQTYGFEEIHFNNIGICGGRQYVAEHFDKSNADFYYFFEDDLVMNGEHTGLCKTGFRTHVPNLYEMSHRIIIKEKFDFLKLCFSEFYSSNNIQCAWYNVPQQIRTEVWPHYDKLPERGFDPNCPLTQINNIHSLDGVAYVTGQIYYSNWPMIVSREGNKKMFLDHKWEKPFEQTWMSQMFQDTVTNKIKPAILLATPFTHDRTEFYKDGQRREN